MAAQRLAISMPEDVAGEVARAAEATDGGNVSAWLTRAAMNELEHQRRRAAMREALEWYEGASGKISDDEIAKAEAQWSKA